MKTVKKLLLLSCFACFVFFGGVQAASADTIVTCFRDCTPTYNNWEGVVTLDLQCNENSPRSYTARLWVNGVSTPLNTKTCPTADIAAVECAIGLDQSNCQGSVDWEFFDAKAPYVVKNVVQNFPDDVFGGDVQGSSPVTLQYGENSIEAYSDGRFVGLETVTVSCDTGLKWSSSRQQCVLPNVDITAVGCLIALNRSSCAGSVSWDFYDAISPYLVEQMVPGFADKTLGTSDKATNVNVVWQHGVNTVQAKSYTYVLGTKAVDIACGTGLTWSSEDKICIDAHIPVLTLTADPVVVRKGQTTTLTWTISDMVQNTCSISGTGLVNHPADTSTDSVVSGLISTQTRFTLTCSSPLHTDTVEYVDVNVIPTLYEL